MGRTATLKRMRAAVAGIDAAELRSGRARPRRVNTTTR
jgi:hypothetical protein